MSTLTVKRKESLILFMGDEICWMLFAQGFNLLVYSPHNSTSLQSLIMTVPFSKRVVLSCLRNHSKVLCKLYCWFSQKHDVLLKEIEQLKEQYVIKFQEVTARIGVLKRIVLKQHNELWKKKCCNCCCFLLTKSNSTTWLPVFLNFVHVFFRFF